jgi:RNA polymerase sigma-70 factor, ECF subfamily
MQDARRAADAAARTSYGRLISILAARSHDIAAAEDALSDAFLSALSHWPEHGVPSNPDAWLITAARNKMNNDYRHQKVVDSNLADLMLFQEVFSAASTELPDDRLKLMFVCAHPAIDPLFRTPLMLQTILGLNATQIASAFLISPTTMGQRLVRAKLKIKQARLRFELPNKEDISNRLADVLNAIYAAYGTSWDAMSGAVEGLHNLADEAIYLCRLIVVELPSEPEPRGLLSLMLFCESRRRARRDFEGRFVPLKNQNTKLWHVDMIVEAEEQLVLASQAKKFGRFQCEAAIQSVHAQRAITGVTHHPALDTLYTLLVTHFPSVGVLVAQAAAQLEGGNHELALNTLGRLDMNDVREYQPYWVTLAAIERAFGQHASAEAAVQKAIGLTEDEGVREFLRHISCT